MRWVVWLPSLCFPYTLRPSFLPAYFLQVHSVPIDVLVYYSLSLFLLGFRFDYKDLWDKYRKPHEFTTYSYGRMADNHSAKSLHGHETTIPHTEIECVA